MYLFITQGYACTALLLFFLYCFHAQLRHYYLSLAITANRLVWLCSLFALLIVIYLKIIGLLGFAIFDFLAGTVARSSLFLPWIIIFIVLLFKKVRQHAVWILLPVAILINLPVLQGVWDRPTATPSGLITIIQFFLFCGLIFFLLTFAIEKIICRIKKEVAKEENRRLPDRI